MKTRISTPWPLSGGLSRLAKVAFQCLLLASALSVTTLPAAGASNYALDFDGSDDRVQAGINLFSTVTNNFTIELWANPTGFRTPTAEANTGISDITGQRYAVFPDHGYESYLGLDHAGAGLSIGYNGISVFEHGYGYLPSLLVYSNAISGWTHVAVVYVNRTPQLYVNGMLVRTGLPSTMTFVHPSASLGGSLGGIGYGNYQGQLDEVRIWDAPLSQAQIRANMNHSLTGDEPNLVVYFRCDEGTGLTLTDHAPAGPTVNGTLTNGTSWLPSPVFVNIDADLPGVGDSSVAWGDFDNDGALDILLTGALGSSPIAHVYRNNGNGTFTYVNVDLPGGYLGSVAWGDFDNDGDLDILLTGALGSSPIARVYRNNGNGTFTDINADLPGVQQSSVAWGDFDNDGNLDILLTGTRVSGTGVSLIASVYRNNGNGTFTDINADLPGVFDSSVAWGDFDNDGNLDILLTGSSYSNSIAHVYRNNGNSTFTDIDAGLPTVFYGSVAWGDFDNDGHLDILLAGTAGFTRVYRNNGNGTFTDLNAELPGVGQSSVAWGDFDNDGDLDILLTGFSGSSRIARVYRNNGRFTNTPPNAPTGLTVAANQGTAILSWNGATDAQTPGAGLTYNVRVGTRPGASDIMGPMAGAGGGRRLPQMGNAQQGLTALLKYNDAAPYYWSVQAVDGAFAGSAFAPEASFRIHTLITPPTTTNILTGDFNGDGRVDQNELNTVLSNYFPNSPFLRMTDVAGLGGTNVTFALTNSPAGAFSVEVTTNLMDWLFLGPATPRYEFTDTNAPAHPQRYYRLRWP